MAQPMKRDTNQAIIAFVKANNWSYQLVADKFKVSRNVVAGLMFRHRHPVSKRVDKNGNKRGSNRSQIGTGYSYPSYQPTYTAKNSVVS